MTRLRVVAVLVASMLLIGCSSDLAPIGGGGSSSDGGSAGQGPGGGAGAGGDGGMGAAGGEPHPCDQAALAEPAATTTYFVAINEPGADNDVCDGLAPTDEGGGHCPFQDLSSPALLALLDGAVDVRVELREGTYLVRGWDGLRIAGAGTSEAERLVVSAYPGERPILDVPDPTGAGCSVDPMSNPDCVRQVVRVGGTYTWVQGLTVQNGLAYDLEVNGGAHHTVRCNTFRYTAEFAQRSDQLKIDGGADDVLVQHNDFSGFRSQAIDMTGVSNVVIEHNDFHDPFDQDAGATGCKLGARDITIRDNDVYDLGSDPRTHAFAMGGTGAPHDHDFAAYRVHVVNNRVWNVAGIVAQVVSCDDCSVEGNVAWNIAAGVLLSASGSETPGECTTAPNGVCLGSRGVVISDNALTTTSDIFVVVEANQATGLSAAQNTYCASSVAAARFGWQPAAADPIAQVGFGEWQALSETDTTSQVLLAGDPACAAP
jgi:hypothetical protein